jgi:hypothetical protein
MILLMASLVPWTGVIWRLGPTRTKRRSDQAGTWAWLARVHTSRVYTGWGGRQSA